MPEAARVIATTRSLRLIYYSLPFLLGTVLGFTFYATAYYENVFHQDAAHRALLFGLAEPGAVIGLVIGTLVLPPRIAADPGKALRTIAWLAVAAAAGAACLALAPDVAVAYAAQLVFAGASAVVIAGVYALLSVALPTRMLTLGFGLSTVWLTFGVLLIGAPSGVPTLNSLITNAFGYRASFWVFVPLFVIGASLLRSASRFVAEDIAKRKITEAADAAVRQERADGIGPSPHGPLARCRLRRRPGPLRRGPRCGRRRDGGGARHERRRQVHAHAGHLRPGGADRRRGHVRRQGHHHLRGLPDRRGRHPAGARRSRHLPRAHGGRVPAGGRLALRRRRRRPGPGHRDGARLLPRAVSSLAHAGRLALGRRAADAQSLHGLHRQTEDC